MYQFATNLEPNTPCYSVSKEKTEECIPVVTRISMTSYLSVTSRINCIVVRCLSHGMCFYRGHDDVVVFLMTSLKTLYQHKNRNLRDYR